MTRLGIAKQLYAAKVRTRPYSRFTQDPKQRQDNADWELKVIAWARLHVDKNGFYSEAELAVTA